MLYIGNHTTSTKGFYAMGKQMLKNGGNTFAFFTRNPRGGNAKEWDKKDINKLLDLMKENNFGPLVAHAPYTYNPCGAKENLRDFAREAMREDLEKLQALPGNYYNFHPGSHVGQGTTIGIDKIADILNDVIFEEQETTVLLETMAGKGTEVGRKFEEIAEIISKVKLNSKLGVCLDTCHVWDGGYNIVDNLDEILEEFDRIIGLDRLKALHLNDSMNNLGAHKDRHQKIGEGFIGLEALSRVVNHKLLQDKPFILETPNDDEGWKKEIATLRALHKEVYGN